MPKLSSKQIAYMGIFTVTLLFLSTIPNRPGSRAFDCVEYEGESNTIVHREQHGFPFVLLKRAISSSSCAAVENYRYGLYDPATSSRVHVLNPDEEHETLDNGYVIGANLAFDVLFWLFISYWLVQIPKYLDKH